MPNDEPSRVIQGDSECGDGHYRPKTDLRNQSAEAKRHAAVLDGVEDALSRESQNPAELSGTRIGRAYQEAAGIPAMLNVARYGLREMGLIRTALRCAAAYYPETNVLVPIRSVAVMSNQPAYKCIVVTLHKSDHVAHNVDISSAGVSANLARPVPGPH
jgi:hypothetical protein